MKGVEKETPISGRLLVLFSSFVCKQQEYCDGCGD